MKSVKLSPKLCALIAGVAIAAVAAPSIAQDYYDSDDVTVTGRGNVPDSVQALHQRVSYADLDLSTGYGRQVLRARIDDTSSFLCDKLNESDDNMGVVPSCRTAAYQDGVRQARYVEGFARRGDWNNPARSEYTGSYPACSSRRTDNCIDLY